MSCFVGTYTGPEIGISLYQWFQDDDFGHHVVFADGSSLGPEVLDGSLIDCSNPFESMKLPPLLQPTESIGPHAAELQLAEGQAVRLKSGQRWVMQSHYVNASDNELLAQDVINFGFTPVEDVNFWVSSWTFNNSVFSVAPGATLDLEFSCEWPESANVMTMMGHMHDFGTSMWVSHETGGSSVQIYRLPDWSPQWQADPVFIDFELGELTPIAGDTFTVGCSFHNTSDEQLEFPREMCVATGVAGPLDAPIECDAGYPD